MQRKIEILELKQPGQPSQQITKVEEVDERIKTLERVNKEMKKQLTCYKDELETIKKCDEVYL